MKTLADYNAKQLDDGLRGVLEEYRPGEYFRLDIGNEVLEVDFRDNLDLKREADSILCTASIGDQVLFETDPVESIRWPSTEDVPDAGPAPEIAWAFVINPKEERLRSFAARLSAVATRGSAIRSVITRSSGNGGQYNGRDGATVDTFQIHHAASTSLNSVLSMMSTGSRQVSANFVIMDDQIIEVVPIGYRAWTSGSASWDKRSVTVEIINSQVGSNDSNWQISDKSYASLARLAAALNIDFPSYALDTARTIPHRDLYRIYGASYPTACPSGVSVDRILQLAKSVGLPEPTPIVQEDELMYIAYVENFGHYLVTPNFVRLTKSQGTITAVKKLTGKDKVVLPFAEFYGLWSDINAGNLSDSQLAGNDEIQELAKKLGLKG